MRWTDVLLMVSVGLIFSSLVVLFVLSIPYLVHLATVWISITLPITGTVIITYYVARRTVL